MKTQFEILANNPLDMVEVSYSRRSQYAHIHLVRLTANNPNGVYNHLISELTPALDAYSGNLSGTDLQKAISKGCTFELNDCSELFRHTASRYEGLVKSVFSKDSQPYLSFFPQGLDEFYHASQDRIRVLIGRLLAQGVLYKEQLGQNDYLDLFTNLQHRYETAFTAQKESLGNVKNSRPIRDILWIGLKKQLYKNMLFIAYTNIDDPKVMLTYFEPSLLRYHDNSSTATTPVKVQIAPATTMAADLKFTANDTILLVNEGDVPIFFYGGETASQAAPAVLTKLPAGEEIELKTSAIGAPANKFLLLMNQDATAKAEVEYSLL